MWAQDWTLPEPTADSYTDDLMNNAKDFSDTAMVVITRVGGEGADPPTDLTAAVILLEVVAIKRFCKRTAGTEVKSAKKE